MEHLHIQAQPFKSHELDVCQEPTSWALQVASQHHLGFQVEGS